MCILAGILLPWNVDRILPAWLQLHSAIVPQLKTHIPLPKLTIHCLSSNCVNVYIYREMALAVLTLENFLSVSFPVVTWTWQSLECLSWEASVVFCSRRMFSSGISHALFASRSSHRDIFLLRCFLKLVQGSSLNLDVRVEFSFCLFVHIYLHVCLHVHFSK